MMRATDKLVCRIYREEWDRATPTNRHVLRLTQVVGRRTGLSSTRVQEITTRFRTSMRLRP